MKIWVVCQYYKPEPGAPSARLSGLAQAWQQAGHSVSVLTAMPNHPKGRLFPAYRGKSSFMKEEIDGITVQRHWLYITPNEGFVKKVLSHLSFAASVLFANLRPRSFRPDVIVASSPSFFAAISAWLLSVRYRVPFVMEVRDLWPGIFVELGVMKPGVVLRVLEVLELFLYRRAAAVVTVTEGFARNINERGIPAQKIHVVTNGVSDAEFQEARHHSADEAAVRNLTAEIQLNPMTKVFLYIGTHGVSQALGQIVDTARLLLARNDILFLFVGDGADKERLVNIARGLPNVQFLGAQEKSRVWTFYRMAQACFVPLKNTPGFKTFIPSKMFEIMAAGAPVIGCVEGEAADILQRSKAALVVSPEDPEKLAAAVVAIADNTERRTALQKAGPDFVAQHYLHSRLGGAYLGVLQQVAGRGTQKTETA